MSLTNMFYDPFARELMEDPMGLASTTSFPSTMFPYPTRQGGYRNLPHTHCDILESNSIYCINAELPGVKKESIDLEVEGDMLNITAEKVKDEGEALEGGAGVWDYRQRERSFGKIRRSMTLPSYVNKDSVKTCFCDGVLRITFDKLGAGVGGIKKLIIA